MSSPRTAPSWCRMSRTGWTANPIRARAVTSLAFTGAPGRSVELEATLAGCAAILNGEADGWAESSLYMAGDFAEARERESRSKGQGP